MGDRDVEVALHGSDQDLDEYAPVRRRTLLVGHLVLELVPAVEAGRGRVDDHARRPRSTWPPSADSDWTEREHHRTVVGDPVEQVDVDAGVRRSRRFYTLRHHRRMVTSRSRDGHESHEPSRDGEPPSDHTYHGRPWMCPRHPPIDRIRRVVSAANVVWRIS